MNYLHKLIGLSLPTTDELVQAQMESNDSDDNDNDENIDQGVIANIQFVLLNDGNVKIFCEWVEENMAVAEICGELLHHINSGNLQGSICEVLAQHGIDNVSSQPFIKKVLMTWNKKGSKNKPLIKPSQVLQTSSDLNMGENEE